MADEKNNAQDDWLDDLEDGDMTSSDLDKLDLDSLLGDSDKSADATDNVELDQSNIDALFDSVGSPSPAESAPGGESGELDQANIDALLGGADSGEDAGQAHAAPEEAGGELDQSSIDDLFGPAEEEAPAQEASPEEIAGGEALAESAPPVAEAETAREEEAGVSGEVEAPAGESFASELDDMEDFFSDLEEEGDESKEPFEAEDLDFGDMLDDTAEEALEIDEAARGGAKAQTEEEATVGMASEDLAEVVAAAREEERQKPGFVLPFLPDSLNHTLVAGVTLGLLVIIAGSWFFLRSGDEKAVPPLAEQEQAEEKAAANSVPVAVDGIYAMGEKAGEVEITLAGEDTDDDPLTYEITSPPMSGILSGNPPELTYLPNKTFSGEDHFEFRVSDGKEQSGLGSVLITGPNLLKLAAMEERKKEEAQVLRPKKPVIVARDVDMRVVSTDEAVIDWARIWRQGNRTAFNDKIYVDVDRDGLRGELKRLNSGQSRYIPDKFFQGRDVIYYRFKQGGVSSATGRIEMRVALGTPPPEIHFNSLAGNYFVGEKVVIDASPTRDENRNSLRFNWEQIAGPPIRITPVNQEGSIITFVMPATFSCQPGPCLRLTAVDEMGQTVSRVLEMTTASRRQTALWRGTGGGDSLAPDPVMDKKLLPWPY